MRIDVHTHIFPPDFIQDRSRFFEREPAFRLLYESPKAKLASAEALLEVMDRDDIDRAVVFGFPWNHSATARAASPVPSTPRTTRHLVIHGISCGCISKTWASLAAAASSTARAAPM